MIEINSFLLAVYLMIAVTYTCTTLINKEVCKKYWYLSLIAIIWCALISLCYFPVDLGYKLSKKLNDEQD